MEGNYADRCTWRGVALLKLSGGATFSLRLRSLLRDGAHFKMLFSQQKKKQNSWMDEEGNFAKVAYNRLTVAKPWKHLKRLFFLHGCDGCSAFQRPKDQRGLGSRLKTAPGQMQSERDVTVHKFRCGVWLWPCTSWNRLLKAPLAFMSASKQNL